MSTPYVLLKADHSLEGDVADDKANRSACHQLGQVSVLQYFRGTAGSLDHQHVLRPAGLSGKVLATGATLFWQTGQVGEWQVIWCLGSNHIIHVVGVLCISMMWLLNFFLLERTLKQELQKWQTAPVSCIMFLSI